jgi:4-amino-4-deoxy-L-arabinose transferase-like glycosyltransferase
MSIQVPSRPRPLARQNALADRGLRAPLAGAAVLLIAYLATRIWFARRFPYFLDEGTYANFTDQASRSVHQLFVSLSIGREPLQVWLGLPFVELGLNPLTAMRAVSVGAGLATVGVVWLLGRRLGGDAVAWVAAALAVVLPFFVVHDGIGIMEPLVTLVMAAALLAQIELARRPSLRLGVLLGCVLAAGVLTKENTKPAIVLIPLSLLVFDWSPSDRRRRLRTWVAGVAIAVAMAVLANVVMRLSAYWDELVRNREEEGLYTVRAVGDVLADPFSSWGKAWSAFWPAIEQYLTLPLLVAAVAGALLGLRRAPRLTALVLAWIAVPTVVALSFASLPFPRHIMYVVPAMLVLAALALVEGGRLLAARLPARRAAPACAVGLALVAAPALVYDARVLAHPDTVRYPDGDDLQYVTGTGGGAIWPSVAATLRERAPAGPVVVLHPRAVPLVVDLMMEEPRFTFPAGRDPRARGADFVLMDEIPFADFDALRIFGEGRFRLVASFRRPRGGATLKLYERARRPARAP